MPENDDPSVSQLLDCSFPHKEPPEQDNFSFETDHEALRCNRDYSVLLRTLAILEAQKSQAIKDTELLFQAQKEALSDPLSIVKRLQSGEVWPQVPGRQKVADIPEIHWEKYKISTCLASKKPETRQGHCLVKRDLSPGGSSGSAALLVRGRPFDDRKPKTFNQPWTTEEQKRLEELLIEYPSEDVEMERWKKIANALGNRTPIQVQSRIQKYFLKLHKAGLPIPGRLTKSKVRFNKPISRLQRRQVTKNSTFFPNNNPSVKMDDDEDESLREDAIYYNRPEEEEDQEEDEIEDLNEGNVSSPKHKELVFMKKVRREIEFELREGSSVHLGYRCDFCNAEPIIGSRWHCVDCLSKEVDFCSKCALTLPEILPQHTKEHKLKPVRLKKKLEGFVDKDYVSNSGKLSYLDTNFMR